MACSTPRSRRPVALIDDLKDPDDARWEEPPLCGELTVHDVVAHLVDNARTTRLSFVGLATN